MAAQRKRGAGADAAAVPLADGGAESGPAEGAPGRDGYQPRLTAVRHNGELFQCEKPVQLPIFGDCGKDLSTFAQTLTVSQLLRCGTPFFRAVVEEHPALAADCPQAK